MGRTDASDDLYGLLGLDARADDDELRRAWRRLALQWHPDRAGADATATFQRIVAAYMVLSDPAERAAYDRRRGLTASAPAPRASDGPREAPVEPPPAPRRRAPGVLLQRLCGSLNTLLARGLARRAERDVIELFLDQQEAAEGGMVTISMRVPVRCPSCAGDATAACARCGGIRVVDELFSAWLAVAPEIAEGTMLKPSALLPGMIRPPSFRVRHLAR